MSDEHQNQQQQQANLPTPTTLDRLSDVLGFDPTKRPMLKDGKAGKLFQDTLAELTKERDEKAKTQAKEIITKAIGLADEWKKAEKQFMQNKAKFVKELGKLLNQLNGMLSGKEPEPEAKEGTNEEQPQS
jgi:hypothetical protein